jgi:ABC-type multidrug transport system fused ATPase/permease subunit
MQTEYIHLLEPTPKLHSKKCKLISFLIRIFLQFTIYIIFLAVWYFYDFFLAILSLVLAFIIMGIIRSKLRNSVIPFNQREYQYNDKAIADWYAARELCYEENADVELL